MAVIGTEGRSGVSVARGRDRAAIWSGSGVETAKRKRGRRKERLGTREEANLLLSCLVVLAPAVPDADILGHQHLWLIVHMADHQRHGLGAVGPSQGGGHGQNQGDEQKQGFDVHGALLDDIDDGSVNVIWIPL